MPTALVTGASTGIGAACVTALAAAGFEVFGGVRNEADADRLRDLGHTPVILDVTDAAHVAGASAVVAPQGRLDLLVNNAGIAIAAPIEVLAPEDLAHQLDVNVVGLHRVTQAFLPALIAARGRIIQISSISGRIGLPFVGAYAASKFAVSGYSESLRREVAPLGVKVTTIEPGQVATPIWDKASPSDEELATVPAHYRDRVEPFAREARRAATHGMPPEAIAAVVVTAATVARPRARYSLPRKDRVVGRLLPLLPERISDRLVQREMDRLR